MKFTRCYATMNVPSSCLRSSRQVDNCRKVEPTGAPPQTPKCHSMGDLGMQVGRLCGETSENRKYPVQVHKDTKSEDIIVLIKCNLNDDHKLLRVTPTNKGHY
jgi:hypothetical protein